MADDYSTNKRKFDDHDAALPEATRRATGFSAPIVSPGSAAAQPQLELAKQKAQEIAARLFNSAEATRVKSENGDNPAYSNDYAQNPTGQPAQTQYFMSTYGSQSSSKTIEIPNGRVGVLIGKGGETIKYLQAQSGAKIQITRDADAIPFSQTRSVDITGSSEQVNRAEQLINDVLAEADIGGSGVLAARKVGNTQYGGEQFSMKVPTNKVGLVIGKGGETIKSMQAKSGARIQVIPLHPPPGDTSLERTVQIDGTNEQIEVAKQLVNEVISGENRTRNQAMSGGGGYSQQSYQPPPQPPMWTPPPQQQPPPPPAANYYAQQPYPQYGGYPPPQQAGYDYYNTPQQQQLPVTAAPTDTNTAYNYNNAYGDGTAYTQQQAYAAYPPQDGGANSTAATATQGYNAPQQAGYYGQPGYGYGYGYPQAPAAYNSTDATAAAPPSASPAAAPKTNPTDS